MVDTRGARDLTLPGQTITYQPLLARDLDVLNSAAERAFFWAPDGADPDEWLRHQMRLIGTAVELESRLMHVRSQRLSDFQLNKHPADVTLAQLAHLHRSHDGVPGQSFELAVAEGCNRGIPDVVEPISRALAQLGVRDHHRPRMMVLGLEKLGSSDEAWSAVRGALPEGAAFRTGMRGRPTSVDTAFKRLTGATWSTMGRLVVPGDPTFDDVMYGPGSTGLVNVGTADISQLGRCDALVWTDTAIVPASLKINRRVTPRDRDPGWRDVPLWISLGDPERHPVVERRATKVPTVIATLPRTAPFLFGMHEAVGIVNGVFKRIDLGTTAELDYAPLIRALYRRRHDTLGQVCADLRAEADPVAAYLLEAAVTVDDHTGVEIQVLDDDDFIEGWQNRALDQGIVLGHEQLWFATRSQSSTAVEPAAPRVVSKPGPPGAQPAPTVRSQTPQHAPRGTQERRRGST